MDETYLLGRIRASLEMASLAAGSAARLIHLDLAGRYSLLAAKFANERPHVDPRLRQPGGSSFYRGDASAAAAG